jgi:hypothetical protein
VEPHAQPRDRQGQTSQGDQYRQLPQVQLPQVQLPQQGQYGQPQYSAGYRQQETAQRNEYGQSSYSHDNRHYAPRPPAGNPPVLRSLGKADTMSIMQAQSWSKGRDFSADIDGNRAKEDNRKSNFWHGQPRVANTGHFDARQTSHMATHGADRHGLKKQYHWDTQDFDDQAMNFGNGYDQPRHFAGDAMIGRESEYINQLRNLAAQATRLADQAVALFPDSARGMNSFKESYEQPFFSSGRRDSRDGNRGSGYSGQLVGRQVGDSNGIRPYGQLPSSTGYHRTDKGQHGENSVAGRSAFNAKKRKPYDGYNDFADSYSDDPSNDLQSADNPIGEAYSRLLKQLRA